jgi:hypothetical protein
VTNLTNDVAVSFEGAHYFCEKEVDTVTVWSRFNELDVRVSIGTGGHL